MPAQAKRPNILLIHTDDQNFHTLGAWGNAEIQTPTLDQLARRGLSFRQAYNQGGHQAAVCIAARAMLLSGKSLWRATAPQGLDTPLLPEFLRERGYETFFTGKWHLGAATLYRSFPRGGYVHLGGMGPQIDPPLRQWQAQEAQRVPGRATDLFTKSCLDFLESQANPQKPFFAYVAYTAPHDPREAGELAKKFYGERTLTLPRPWFPSPPLDNGETKIRDEMVVPAPRSREQCQKELRDYYALITELDQAIGKLLALLEAKGVLKDTIVAFISDNGLAMGAHGLMGKQSMYEHSLRVPFLLAGPGVKRGQEPNPVYSYELFGRLAALAGLEKPAAVEAASPERPLYFGYRDFQRAVRVGRYKMIWSRNAKGVVKEQYDLAKDPWEENNLAGKATALAEDRFVAAAERGRAFFGDPVALPTA